MRESSPGRPRREDLDDRILQATAKSLADHGVAGTTIEAVAAAAGTTKPAVYRRWPTKNDLVVAAVRSLSSPPTIPDTGSLRDDVRFCALRYTQAPPDAVRVLRGVLGEAAHDPELAAAAYEVLGKPPAAALEQVIRRAAERGDIPTDAPVALAAAVVPAVAFRSLFTSGQPLTEAEVTGLVDRVVLPALHGG